MNEALHYLDVGEGPPLLMLHGGFTDGRATWTVQLRSLASLRRMIVPDRRGHGASPRDPRPYTIVGDATDALEVVDRAGVDVFDVAALSYGGLVAIELARTAPGRVRSLHLIEPPYLSLLPNDHDVRMLDATVRRIRAQGTRRSSEWVASEFFRAILGEEGLGATQANPFVWRAILTEAPRFLDEEYAGEYPADAVTGLRPGILARVYTGGRSSPALRAVARRLSELIPGAELVVVPEASHGVQYSGEPFDRRLLEATGLASTDLP